MGKKMGNYEKFLLFLHVMVDESSKECPLTRSEIIKYCNDAGFQIAPWTFDNYIRFARDGGIIIKSRNFRGGNSKKLYWYDAGWI